MSMCTYEMSDRSDEDVMVKMRLQECNAECWRGSTVKCAILITSDSLYTHTTAYSYTAVLIYQHNTLTLHACRYEYV